MNISTDNSPRPPHGLMNLCVCVCVCVCVCEGSRNHGTDNETSDTALGPVQIQFTELTELLFLLSQTVLFSRSRHMS